MKVLLTGATGYIGRRLKRELLADPAVGLRLLVRNARKLGEPEDPRVEVVEGNTFDSASLHWAVRGMDVAYYLIHSMGSGGDFREKDRRSAENFRDACIQAGVNRIIYLGGLGVRETASEHLISRIETGEILSARPEAIQTIWFRAGVIIGSGSASFEIIRNLVQKVPVMITPKWVRTRTQPIAVDDVISYLMAAKDVEAFGNLVVDIGSAPLSFGQMMEKAAGVMGLRRVLIPVPLLTPRLSSYWLILFTPVPFSIASALIEGLKSETLATNDNAQKHFPGIRPFSYEDAVRRAIDEIEKNQVISRWCDSGDPVSCTFREDELASAVYRDERFYDFGNLSSRAVYEAMTSVGGDAGWIEYGFLWKIRGVLDKLFGGCGLNRGRRSQHDLRIGDSLDFWRVVDLKPNERLLLFSQMKLPGKAWLEFSIRGHRLYQTAYFYPNGLLGRAYWILVLPLHNLVFSGLVRGIIKRAEENMPTHRRPSLT